MRDYDRSIAAVDAARKLQAAPETTAPQPVAVSVADVFDNPPQPPAFIIDEIIPSGTVTLLGANGGAGKSMLALTAAVCASMGLMFLGLRTRRCRVLFFSAEDAAPHLRYRLAKICRHLNVDPHEVAINIQVLDATGTDAALFRELNIAGVKTGTTTPAYDLLKRRVESSKIELLVVDNASDAFDASEIDRARVRAFMRSLAEMVKAHGGAVLLLAHVDKNAAKGFATTQGYSGSTAWNNSARSRLFLGEQDGRLVLEHQKSNHGKKAEPISLEWLDGVLAVAGTKTGSSAGIDAAKALESSKRLSAVLGLFSEFYERGEWVATGATSPDNPYKKFAKERSYPPKLAKDDLISMIRDAERDGLLVAEEYQTQQRKTKARWALTEKGKSMIAPSAPSAPSAPTTEDDASQNMAQEVRHLRHLAHGGVWGGESAQEDGANPPPLPDRTIENVAVSETEGDL